jgi:hypothetical protein
VPWNDVLKWRSNEKLVLVYPAANLFYLIPRHFFQSESDYCEFLALLNSKLGKAR